MNKDASDFMAQEYDRISTAYFSLREQMGQIFKAYLSLIGFPLTVLAAVANIGEPSPFSLSDLPDIVSGVMIVVSVLGFLVCTIIVSIRMEMILYARTINGVRRYFASVPSESAALPQFLVLPTSDTKPPFFEGWRALLQQVVLMGLLDGTILGTAVQSLYGSDWPRGVAFGLVYLALHIVFYWLVARRREKAWKTRFNDSLGISNW